MSEDKYKYESKAESAFALELQISGKQAERQFSIGKYFADFYFPEYNLVLEIDGKEFHSSPDMVEHDKNRNKFMNDLGYTVVRVTGTLAIKNPSGVFNVLRLFPKGRTFYLTDEKDLATAQKIAASQNI
jgi:very-short-patch-repair endonuclease